ncbi:hypothetical protein AVEN_111895-1 [Araneus ventricosus]|uniref:Uncharacterized protein n=1 Tax=Araneus ventricosus TaxID=182803 RepID=A0A4Y2CZZ4_ARAVE|nr:hypothetical protein AVEN_111895-1 [Araneus ventricosus]
MLRQIYSKSAYDVFPTPVAICIVFIRVEMLFLWCPIILLSKSSRRSPLEYYKKQNNSIPIILEDRYSTYGKSNELWGIFTINFRCLPLLSARIDSVEVESGFPPRRE